jgi:hypothetical protein
MILGFNLIVVVDSSSQKAIAANQSINQSINQSVEAWCDDDRDMWKSTRFVEAMTETLVSRNMKYENKTLS